MRNLFRSLYCLPMRVLAEQTAGWAGEKTEKEVVGREQDRIDIAHLRMRLGDDAGA